MQSTDLHTTIDDKFELLAKSIKEFTFPFTPNEVGYITSVATGIAKVSGLPGAGFEELGEWLTAKATAAGFFFRGPVRAMFRFYVSGHEMAIT